MFPLLPHKVLFFEDENKRAELVQQLNPEAEGSGQQIATRPMREKEILGEALTREQRAQIVETFIRHAFSEVTTSIHLVSLFRRSGGTRSRSGLGHGVGISVCLRSDLRLREQIGSLGVDLSGFCGQPRLTCVISLMTIR